MHSTVVFLLAILGCSLAAPQPEGRIIGGEEVKIEDYPYMASIQRDRKHICGGVIHSALNIITAAHCVNQVKANTLQVRVGSNDWTTDGRVYYVSVIKIHEDFNPITMDNDIAVLRLSQNMQFTSTIKVIPMATSYPIDRSDATIAGWGTVAYGYQEMPTKLRATKVYVLTAKTCGSYDYGYGARVLPSMMCGLAPGKDACDGDAGGGLVQFGRLAGIASWGKGCALPGYPGVYANVASLSAWISKATA